jgi:U4/U6 small nuclear ribonucleoprotein PRP3
MALETEHNGAGEAKKEKRKRRWGNAAPDAEPAAAAAAAVPSAAVPSAAATPAAPLDPKAKVLAMQESIRARLAAAKAKQAGVGVVGTQPAASVVASTSVAVPATAAAAASWKKRPAETSTASLAAETTSKRAKVYELDMTVTGPIAPASNKPVRKINPYLAHLEVAPPKPKPKAKDNDKELSAKGAAADIAAMNDDDQNVDDRLVRTSKPRPRHKTMSFVEPGSYQELAERKRDMAKAAAASGFVSGRKTGHTIHSHTMGTDDMTAYQATTSTDDVDDGALAPRADAHPDTTMPLALEWWDVELLPLKLKKQVAAAESKKLSKQTQAALHNLGGSSTAATTTVDNDTGDENDKKEATALESKENEQQQLQAKCLEQASLSYSKTAALVQHIVPVKPPNANTAPAKQAILHLTKKELKRQRKLRRGEKQRELQDLQAAGLIPAPEPRLTLSNFIRVLGDQAFLDPSQMEQKVAEQMQARQRAHLETNLSNKLTKEQRAAKRAKKLEEDVSQGVTMAIFYVKDMSHPYHRTKVDLNAQQNFLTGGVLECQDPALSCVIIEGGPKAVKRYTRLMTVRMKWQGPDDQNDGYEEEQVEEEGDLDDDDTKEAPPKFNPDNKCELVWQGMGVKRLFKGFVFQSCESSDQARKVLKQKGVGHYWDQVLQHASGRGDNLQLKLTSTDNQDDGDNAFAQDDDEDEDIVMQDS